MPYIVWLDTQKAASGQYDKLITGIRKLVGIPGRSPICWKATLSGRRETGSEACADFHNQKKHIKTIRTITSKSIAARPRTPTNAELHRGASIDCMTGAARNRQCFRSTSSWGQPGFSRRLGNERSPYHAMRTNLKARLLADELEYFTVAVL